MSTDTRTSYCVFRCRDSERIAIGRAASFHGETLASFCRRAALAAVRQVGDDLIDVTWLTEAIDPPDDDEDDAPWQDEKR